MTTLQLRNSSRGSLPKNVPISQWRPCPGSLAEIPHPESPPLMPALQNSFPAGFEREKAGRTHSVLMFLVAPPSRLGELSLNALRSVFTSQIFLSGLAPIWPGDRHGRPWDEWDTLGVTLKELWSREEDTVGKLLKDDELWERAGKVSKSLNLGR